LWFFIHRSQENSNKVKKKRASTLPRNFAPPESTPEPSTEPKTEVVAPNKTSLKENLISKTKRFLNNSSKSKISQQNKLIENTSESTHKVDKDEQKINPSETSKYSSSEEESEENDSSIDGSSETESESEEDDDSSVSEPKTVTSSPSKFSSLSRNLNRKPSAIPEEEEDAVAQAANSKLANTNDSSKVPGNQKNATITKDNSDDSDISSISALSDDDISDEDDDENEGNEDEEVKDEKIKSKIISNEKNNNSQNKTLSTRSNNTESPSKSPGTTPFISNTKESLPPSSLSKSTPENPAIERETSFDLSDLSSLSDDGSSEPDIKTNVKYVTQVLFFSLAGSSLILKNKRTYLVSSI